MSQNEIETIIKHLDTLYSRLNECLHKCHSSSYKLSSQLNNSSVSYNFETEWTKTNQLFENEYQEVLSALRKYVQTNYETKMNLTESIHDINKQVSDIMSKFNQ